MADLEKIGLEAVLETANFSQGLDTYLGGVNTANEQTASFTEQAGADFLSLGNAVLTGLGGLAVAGFGALTAAIGLSITEAMDAEENIALLEARLQSTGGASGMTAAELLAMADALSLETRYSDDAILSAETILLKFTAIGEDVFPQATQAVLDIAAGMGIDASQAAQILGKALADPGEGLARLKTLGVVFTAQEEEQIKAMVAAGDVAGAQQIILDKLATSMGGAAVAAGDTLAGKIDILKNRFANMAETIGTAVLPFIETLWADYIEPAIPAIEDLATKVSEFLTILLGSGAASSEMETFLASFLDKATITAIYNIIGGVQNFINAISTFVDDYSEELIGAIGGIAAVLGGAAIAAAISAIVTAIGAISAPIVVLIGAAALLGAAWNGNWFGIRDTLTAVWTETIQPALQTLWDWLSVNIPIAIQFLSDLWTNTLYPALQTVGAFIQTELSEAFTFLSNLWVTSLLPAMQTIWAAIETNILPLLVQLYAWFQDNLPVAIQTVSDFWNNIMQPALFSFWTFVSTYVIPIITDLVVWLIEQIPVAVQAAADFWNNVLWPALNAVWAFITNYVVPTFITVVEWLATNIPLAIQTVSDFWNNTLLPAITAVWDYFDKYILPIIQEVIDIFNLGMTLAVTALAGLWQNVLQPALSGIWTYINDNILPIFVSIATYISDTLGPKINWLVTNVVTPFKNALVSLVTAGLQWVYDKLVELKDILGNITLPVWLTPGSPTPFEMGLRGIGKALVEVRSQMDQLAAVELPALSVAAPGELIGGSLSAPASASVSVPAGQVNNVSKSVSFGDTYVGSNMDLAVVQAALVSALSGSGA